jgi:glycine/D-amino acid oxidase-like deaminating enzyme
MAQQYRAIVIGCGAVGAATTYWLSRRLGGGVLALEQYQHGHSRGVSEDHSRVIRHAYSRPEYTALTPAAYQSWNVAERGTGLQLVYRTGGLIRARVAGRAGLRRRRTRGQVRRAARPGHHRARPRRLSRFPVSAFSATRPALTGAAAAPTRVNSM